MNLPFREELKNGFHIRTFSSNLDESELKWHWDEEDRIVVCEHDTDWMIQIDNQLPSKIEKNTPIYIPNGEYHRLIKGDKDLIVKVKKQPQMKIDNEYVVGEVKEIAPKIFAVCIKDQYQRAMLFCRYVEFHSSPYDDIRNKFFTWEKFMQRYKSDFDKDVFTYSDDWEGFGIPSDSIKTAIKVFNKASGPYDDIMNDIYSYCNRKVNNSKTIWYLIGIDDFNSKTMDHEVAHALYSIDDEYKKICDNLVSKISGKDYQTLKNKIKDMGYEDDIETINDEIQACMSTGLVDELNTKELQKYKQDFIENFKKFNI